jgi:transposase
LRIKYLCEDLDLLRRRLKDLVRDIERKLDDHEVGKLLTTIDGVGPLTAACLIAELGDPARFRSAGAVATYVGVAPRLRESGKKRFSGSPTIPFGNARLRKALGWWFLTPSAAIRGCGSITNDFEPWASLERSPSSRRCESC